MGPADLLDYDHEKIAGVLVEEGTATSHVAIVARALDVPMLGGLRDIADQISGGDQIIIDAEQGEVHVRPQAQLVTAFEQKLSLSEERRARFDALRDLPADTADGVHIDLSMNAGLLFDLPHLAETGADGDRSISYRTSVYGVAHLPEIESANGSLLGSSGGCCAVDRSRSELSILGVTRSCPMWIRLKRKIRPWGGVRSGSRSIAQGCCAISSAP